MTNNLRKIMSCLREIQPCRIEEVIAKAKISKTSAYDLLNTRRFVKTRIEKDSVGFYYVYAINPQFVEDREKPHHHPIHQAFWGSFPGSISC